jgi:hypothetical protein
MIRRISIASALGFVCGIICLMLSKYAAGNELTATVIANGLFNRTLMGFLIATTACPWKPAARGALLGFLVSVAYAIPMASPVPPVVAGTIYGMFIDVITTSVFKADGK